MRASLAIAAIAACGAREDPAPGPQASAQRVGRVEPAPKTAARADPLLPAAHVPTVAPEAEPELPPQGDHPRAVPPGTPPHIARVFQRLPVALHDGPPVGAIGASGIHVDKIWIGEAYEKEGCTGESERFSLARHSQVNVCFRVVHSRAEESVEVLWEKDGAIFRRRQLMIPDIHAYRTRAYLALRREYAGSWTARVLSSDGVELASQAFTVE